MKFQLALLLIILCVTAKTQNTANYLNNVKNNFGARALLSDSLIEKHDIFLIGETHGFKVNYDISYQLIKTFKEKTDFTYILAEMDWAIAQILNTALIDGDNQKLLALMNEFRGSPAWCKERYDFYLKLIALNKNATNKIQFIGVDIPSGGIGPALKKIKLLKSKYAEETAFIDQYISEPNIDTTLLNYAKNILSNPTALNYSDKDRFELFYHLQNICNYHIAINTATMNDWDRIRDSCMFINYKLLEKELELEDEKMIGSWGYTHTYQRASEGISWFASLLKEKSGRTIHSTRIFYSKSKCMIPASWMPGLLSFYRSKKKEYYITKLQNDDSWATGKLSGLKPLFKTCNANTITLFNLNQVNSPYHKSYDLFQSTSPTGYTTDYFQAAIVVKNGIPTTPFEK